MSVPATMRAIRIHATGGPEVLRLEDVPVPRPGAGEALVRLEATGLNFIEIYQRRGIYQAALPVTQGSEAAGRVVAVGDGVRGPAVGDLVASQSFRGAYAEYALAAADTLVPLPPGVDAKLGAAVMLQGMTAHYLACSTYALRSGETCLVHAAAGGVGLLLCQVAKLRGARVIGTVSTPEKAELARGAGADHVVLYREQDFETETRRLTGGRGVQVVYDSVGADTFEKSLRCLVPRGLMVLFGASSGPVPPFDPQTLNRLGSLFVTRPKLADYVATREELLARADQVLSWVRDGSLRVRVHAEFPLERAAEAQRALESRATTGKLLLVP